MMVIRTVRPVLRSGNANDLVHVALATGNSRTGGRRLGEMHRRGDPSPAKTPITHGRTSAARFLGYEITTQHANHVIAGGRRVANGGIRLRGPREVIKTKCSRYMQR